MRNGTSDVTFRDGRYLLNAVRVSEVYGGARQEPFSVGLFVVCSKTKRLSARLHSDSRCGAKLPTKTALCGRYDAVT